MPYTKSQELMAYVKAFTTFSKVIYKFEIAKHSSPILLLDEKII